jgi:hypothetical protein
MARGDVFSAAGWRVAPSNIEGVERLTPFNRTKLRSANQFRCAWRSTSSSAAELALALAYLAPLAIPDLKAFVMKPNRSPVIRADSHGHPLIRRDGLSATVTGLADTSTMSEFDQVV